MPEPLLVAKSKVELCLLPQFTNRHGLIAGSGGKSFAECLEACSAAPPRAGAASRAPHATKC